MNANTEVKSLQNNTLHSPQNGHAEIYYPETEKKIMGETDFHYQQIKLLMDALELFFAGRNDVYISADIMVYYEEGKPRRHFAPDLMVCFGLENKKRRTYKLWEEKVAPSVIFEIASNSTWQNDVGKKRQLYEKLGVSEYYIYDPEDEYLPQPFIAYRLEFGELVRQQIEENRIFSEALNLELIDDDQELRLYNHITNEYLPTTAEFATYKILANQEIARLKAEIDKLKQQK